MKPKKGFTLVELMVVVAIIAILAAVALPMYSTFKQRTKVSTVIKVCTGASSALQAWYMIHGNFVGPNVPEKGGTIRFATSSAGTGLPQVEDVNWSITTVTSSVIRINWHFTEGCPPSDCDGYWELTCSSVVEKCWIAVTLDPSNTLGLNVP